MFQDNYSCIFSILFEVIKSNPRLRQSYVKNLNDCQTRQQSCLAKAQTFDDMAKKVHEYD